MSGLAGILRTDGAPAAEAALEAMTATLVHRGPDGGDRWIRGPIGLAHLLLRTVPDDIAGRQPAVSPDGERCLTLDGRVDNRDELRAQLGGDRDLLRDGSDASLVLQGYLRWGTGVLARIVGDFALALWDGRRGELLLARDVLGRRPLYYHADGQGLRWASEPQAVLADPAIPRAADVGMVAEFLAGTPRDREDTLIAGLRRLPPAHLLTAGAGGVRTARYWDWDPEHVVRHASDSGYVEEFTERFTQAVACRTLGPHPVGAELSGGVDSSAAVATAATLLPRDALRLFALVFPGCDGDETPYIRAVAEHYGLPVDEHDPPPQGAAFYTAQTARLLVLPEPPNLAMHRGTSAAARCAGCRVMLTGQGGDEWFTGSPFAYADRLRTLRPAGWRAARAGARADRAQWPARSALHQLARDGVIPLLPPPAQRAAGRLTGRGQPLPPWLTGDLRRATGLEERLRTTPPRGPRLAAAHLAQTLHDGWAAHVAETAERAYAEQGLEPRSPFEDRRLIEFALAVPDDVRRRDGATKWVVRAAMAGRLPDAVRLRGGKAGFREVFFREFRAQGGRALFGGLAIEELGWVDGERLRAAYDRAEALHSRGFGDPWIWALWCALSTERWVRATIPRMSASH